jgi:soluble lytic murein transglycosylase
MHSVLWLGALLLSGIAYGAADDLAPQRGLYRQAQQALEAGDERRFRALQQGLTEYPLYPYLVFAELMVRLPEASPDEVQGFLDRYRDTPLGSRLRRAWLGTLMEQGRWREFLQVYDRDRDTALSCYALRARIRAGRLDGVAQRTRALYLVGHSQPKTCDRLFAWWERQGDLTPAVIWRRIALAMAEGQTGLARHLAKKLDPQARAQVRLWVQVHSHPQQGLDDARLRADTERNRQIVAHGLRRLAQKDVALAQARWESLSGRYRFSAQRRDALARHMALLAAYRDHPQAQRWLDALPETAMNARVRLWRARTALRDGQWGRLIQAIQALDANQRDREMWRYWLARALEQTAQAARARGIYRSLAGKRDYYGFLAADRIDAPYAIASDPLVEDRGQARSLMQRPGILRAHELYRLGEVAQARAEWNRVVRTLGREGLKRAAVLADGWGWHANAIRTAALTGHSDDLALRFPIPFQEQVLQTARDNRLTPALIYGIIRRESVFDPEARSPSGALGLMQLMPATARALSRRLGLSRPRERDLLDHGLNMRLGGAYLREMLERFDHNPVLAAAAYNAGPARVQGWLEQAGRVEADVWIDTLPYYETRRYVRAVMAFTTVYEWRLGLPVTRLRERMAPVEDRLAHSHEASDLLVVQAEDLDHRVQGVGGK